MKFLYNSSIYILQVGIFIASFFNEKAKKFVNGRKDLLLRLSEELKGKESVDLWIHCASVGEFEQGRPIIESLKSAQPELKILLTFFSPSGYELRKDYTLVDWVYYLPIDSKKNANKFIEIIQPKAVVFVKYEFWANYIVAIKQRQIPFYLVSAIFRADQRFFKNKWFGDLLKKVSHFYVQNEESKELLNGIDIEQVTVAGDTRFDRVLEVAGQAKKLPLIEKFKGKSELFVLGSSWKQDEVLVKDWFPRQNESIKLLIAPHEVSYSRIEEVKAIFGKDSVCYSQSSIENIEQYNVLIVDHIGMLSSIYSYANYTFIGGGFGAGIHNTLEAAAYGMPIFFDLNSRNSMRPRLLLG